MLDGRDEKKPYSAAKKIFLDEERYSQITMHFTAFDDEDARRFLKEGGYDGYELILTEKL